MTRLGTLFTLTKTTNRRFVTIVHQQLCTFQICRKQLLNRLFGDYLVNLIKLLT